MTAYMTAHLNVDGDVYRNAAEVDLNIQKPKIYFSKENYWLKTENGSQVRE